MRPQPDFIHEFVPGKSTRTLLLLHGTGGNERDLIPLGRELDAEASLLSPRGKILENGMPRFFRRLAEGVFDLEDLQKRTHELADFVISAAAHYKIDNQQIVAVGYSNGANIAASLLLRHPKSLRGAILFRAMVPFVPQAPPDLKDVAVFLAAGRRDSMVDPAESERLQRLLESGGASVTLQWQPGGHELTQADLDAAKKWFQLHT